MYISEQILLQFFTQIFNITTWPAMLVLGTRQRLMLILAISLLEPISRRRNANCEILIVWDDRSLGEKGGVACKWGV